MFSSLLLSALHQQNRESTWCRSTICSCVSSARHFVLEYIEAAWGCNITGRKVLLTIHMEYFTGISEGCTYTLKILCEFNSGGLSRYHFVLFVLVCLDYALLHNITKLSQDDQKLTWANPVSWTKFKNLFTTSAASQCIYVWVWNKLSEHWDLK